MKARMYGMKTGYVPNAKADMRRNKKVYQRSMEQSLLKARVQRTKEKSGHVN